MAAAISKCLCTSPYLDGKFLVGVKVHVGLKEALESKSQMIVGSEMRNSKHFIFLPKQ